MISIERSNSETLTTYTIVSLLSHAVVYAFLIHSVRGYVDGWQYLHMLVLFYLCAFALSPLYGILADLTENCHRIAQCGIMLQLCGILFPYKWQAEFLPIPVSVSIKMILLGIGFGLFHTFAATTILRRDRGRSAHIGIFLSTGPLGMAIILLKPTFGFYLIPLLAFAAAMPDNCKAYGLSLPPKKEKKYPLLAFLGVLMLIAAFALQVLALPSLDALTPKDKLPFLLLTLLLCAGPFAGGILSDFLSPVLLALTLPVGGYLLYTSSEGVKAMLGILLCAASLPLLIRLTADLLPTAPGFAYGLCACLFFPLAWIRVRSPEMVQQLPISPALLGGIAACVAILATALLTRKLGLLPPFLLAKCKGLRTRAQALQKGDDAS